MCTRLQLQNGQLNDDEFRQGRLILDSKPRLIFIEITQNCNLHCPMCRPATAYDRALDMPFELFAIIADELFPYAEIVDLRGFGESTIRKDFPEFLTYAANFQAQLKLITNLTVGRKDLLDDLMRYDVITGVSFDAATAPTFERLRAGANFAHVVSNLGYLIEARQRFGRPKDRVYLCVVVQRDNIEEISEIVQLAHSMDIPLVKLFPFCGPTSLKEHPFRYKEEIRRMLDRVHEEAHRTGVEVELGASMHPNLTIQSKSVERCIHPWTHCYISATGGIGFCDHLISHPYYHLGHWSDGQFRAIWNGEGFQRLRGEHIKGPGGTSKRFRACRWCYKFRYSDVEHWLVPSEQRRLVSTQGPQGLYEANNFSAPRVRLQFP